ncbi:FAD-dependent monooxygenase [Bradyrhizobium japonicum]
MSATTRRDNFDFRRLLHEAAGAEFDVAFEHIGFWDLRFALADDYRAERVFIAGDAAHSHPPYGGYGVNSGLEDAVNLSWKLAATLQGWVVPVCSTVTVRNGGQCSPPQRAISSRSRSSATATSSASTIRGATAPTSRRRGASGRPVRELR